jgi:hypothetical protein
MRFSLLAVAAVSVLLPENVAAFGVPPSLVRQRHSMPLPQSIGAIATHADSSLLKGHQQQQCSRLFASSDSAPENVSTSATTADDKEVMKAYEEWRLKFKKGEFNAGRYENFKQNFLVVLETNAATRQQAAASGQSEEDIADMLLALNEYGDFTAEEYATALEGSSSSSGSVSTGDVLAKAMEAAQAQTDAGVAIEEAFEALAEEEEVRLHRMKESVELLLGSRKLCHRRRKHLYFTCCSLCFLRRLVCPGISLGLLVCQTLLCTTTNFGSRNLRKSLDLAVSRSWKRPLTQWRGLQRMGV